MTLEQIVEAMQCGSCRTPETQATCSVCSRTAAAIAAVRERFALPVIDTCARCISCVTNADEEGDFCERDPAQRDVDQGAAPPAWCPLRGAS